MAVVHLIPIASASPRIDLGDQAIAVRLARIPPFGVHYPGQLRWSLAGLAHADSSDERYLRRWTMLLRSGGIELARFKFINTWPSSPERPKYYVPAAELEQDVALAIGRLRDDADPAWLSAPFLYSFRVLNVDGLAIGSADSYRRANDRVLPDEAIVGEPAQLADPGVSLDEAVRRSCDLLWQACGYPRSPSFQGNQWKNART